MIEMLLYLIIGILIGYNLGYKKGEKKTIKNTIKSMPLILKEQSLIKGYCIICNQKNHYQSRL